MKGLVCTVSYIPYDNCLGVLSCLVTVGSMSVYNSVLVAFSVIVKTDYETDGSSAALVYSYTASDALWAR